MVDDEKKEDQTSGEAGRRLGLEIAASAPQETPAPPKIDEKISSGAAENMSSGLQTPPINNYPQASNGGGSLTIGYIAMAAVVGLCVMFYLLQKSSSARMDKMDSALAGFSSALTQERQKIGRMDNTLLKMELGRSLAALDKVIALKNPMLSAEAIKLKGGVARTMRELNMAVAEPEPVSEASTAPGVNEDTPLAEPADTNPAEEDKADSPAPAGEQPSAPAAAPAAEEQSTAPGATEKEAPPAIPGKPGPAMEDKAEAPAPAAAQVSTPANKGPAPTESATGHEPGSQS
ncbi:MAG: hypothetical protein OEV92_12860 [Nitrospinota bacterium]|nr:hypothetical protein [Nitrospinota bacterium]